MIENLIEIDKNITLILNGSHSLFADGLAMNATSTYIWLAFYLSLLYVIIRRSGDMKFISLTVLAIVLCIILADQGASSLSKPLVQRFRPSQDPSFLISVDVVNGYRGGMYGFFSSHAANTFALATFFSLVVKWKPLSFHLYIWALVNSWTRVYLGVHYFGDLLIGAMYGIIVGLVIYCCYKKVSFTSTSISRLDSSGITTSSGFSTYDVRFIPLSLVVTYIYICFCALVFI